MVFGNALIHDAPAYDASAYDVPDHVCGLKPAAGSANF